MPVPTMTFQFPLHYKLMHLITQTPIFTAFLYKLILKHYTMRTQHLYTRKAMTITATAFPQQNTPLSVITYDILRGHYSLNIQIIT